MTENPVVTDSIFLSSQGATPEDPIVVLERWLAEAKSLIGFPATAMALATSTPQGDPDVRIVLLQALYEGGLVFFTNLASAKGRQLLANPKAAVCFHWPAMGRQVRLRGTVRETDVHYADEYFAARPRGSQIGAHASPQSTPLADRTALIQLVDDAGARFARRPVPRPAHWTGLILVPVEIEFWEDGTDRLHDRMLFQRSSGGVAWTKSRLAP
jgi:pyridoxamine 5'-phosphate oxidase